MNLKERIKEILEEFRTKNYHCGFKEGSTKPCKCPDNIDQALTDILKASKLDEEKILGIIKDAQIPAKPDNDETYLHLEWIEAVAKAIAKGDVYKERLRRKINQRIRREKRKPITYIK